METTQASFSHLLWENPIETILKNQCIAVIDGAMGTELESRGCDLNDDLGSACILLEQPELIHAGSY